MPAETFAPGWSTRPRPSSRFFSHRPQPVGFFQSLIPNPFLSTFRLPPSAFRQYTAGGFSLGTSKGCPMRRIWLAIRLFFLTLFRTDVARQVAEMLAVKTATRRKRRWSQPRPHRRRRRRRRRQNSRPAATRSRCWRRCSGRRGWWISCKSRWTLTATPRSAPPSAMSTANAARCSTRLFGLRPILTAARRRRGGGSGGLRRAAAIGSPAT